MKKYIPWLIAASLAYYVYSKDKNPAIAPPNGGGNGTPCTPQPKRWLIDGALTHEDVLKQQYIYWPDNTLLPPPDGVGWYKEDQFVISNPFIINALDTSAKRANHWQSIMGGLVAGAIPAKAEINSAYGAAKAAGGKVGPYTNIVQQCL